MPGALARPAAGGGGAAPPNLALVAETPDFLTLKEHRAADHRYERGVRRLVVGGLTALGAVALLNVLGQTPVGSIGAGEAATLEVSAPTRLRGGIFYQGRFTIRAHEDVDHATLVLDEGWLESMHINTIEPQPVGEASRQGRLALDFGHVPAGDFIRVYLQFQVNPTNVGRRSQSVELHDDETPLAAVARTVTIFP